MVLYIPEKQQSPPSYLHSGLFVSSLQYPSPSRCGRLHKTKIEQDHSSVNSKITDKLRYLSVISKQTHLFLDTFESCYNHKQMSVKIEIKSHIQQKKMKKFCQYEKSLLKQQ